MLIGLGAGLLGAFAAARLLAGYLHGVTSHDPLVFAATALVLAAIAMLACWLPARRAAKADPVTALRAE